MIFFFFVPKNLKFVGFVFLNLYCQTILCVLFRKIQHIVFSAAQGDKTLHHICDGNICGNSLNVEHWKRSFFPFIDSFYMLHRTLLSYIANIYNYNWNMMENSPTQFMCTSKHCSRHMETLSKCFECNRNTVSMYRQ